MKLLTDMPAKSSKRPRMKKEKQILFNELFLLASTIIIDEACTMRAAALTALARTAADLQGHEHEPATPFRGKRVILSGDARQSLTIIRHGGRAETITACVMN